MKVVRLLKYGIILACAAMLASCPSPYSGEGRVTIAADVRSAERSLPASARTILPVIEPVSYRATFSGGPETVEPVSLGSGGTGTIDLSFGTWTLTVEGLNADGAAIASGTDTFTLSAINPTHTAAVSVRALETGTGTVDLTITWPAGLNPEVDSYSVTLNNVEVPAENITTNYSAEPRSLRYVQDLPAGSYEVKVLLKHGLIERNKYDEALQIGNRLTSHKTVTRDANTFINAGIPEGKTIDHRHARLSVLQSISQSIITQTKSTLHIGYGHTSHGSQITDGMTGLASWSGAPESGVPYQWSSTETSGKLHLFEGAGYGSGFLELDAGYYPSWINETQEFLDNPANSEFNVIMWSWCGQLSGLSSQQLIERYLNPMTQFEIDNPNVTFIYMTGHLDGSGVTGNLNVRNQQIRDYCSANDKWLFDFADIESYDPDDVYYLDKAANDECYYDSDGNGSRDKNWAIDWQNANTGAWYSCGSAHSQPLNANMKAYAAWYLFARIAGWSGN